MIEAAFPSTLPAFLDRFGDEGQCRDYLARQNGLTVSAAEPAMGIGRIIYLRARPMNAPPAATKSR